MVLPEVNVFVWQARSAQRGGGGDGFRGLFEAEIEVCTVTMPTGRAELSLNLTQRAGSLLFFSSPSTCVVGKTFDLDLGLETFSKIHL